MKIIVSERTVGSLMNYMNDWLLLRLHMPEPRRIAAWYWVDQSTVKTFFLEKSNFLAMIALLLAVSTHRNEWLYFISFSHARKYMKKLNKSRHEIIVIPGAHLLNKPLHPFSYFSRKQFSTLCPKFIQKWGVKFLMDFQPLTFLKNVKSYFLKKMQFICTKNTPNACEILNIDFPAVSLNPIFPKAQWPYMKVQSSSLLLFYIFGFLEINGVAMTQKMIFFSSN